MCLGCFRRVSGQENFFLTLSESSASRFVGAIQHFAVVKAFWTRAYFDQRVLRSLLGGQGHLNNSFCNWSAVVQA